jgi:hypothetical protein
MSAPGTQIAEAALLIRSARHLTAFTGAGISVESGIPPFRGPGGRWNKYDPRLLELTHFLKHPEVSWPVLKEIFYDHFGAARPNRAHEVLAAWEARGLLRTLLTQNPTSFSDTRRMFCAMAASCICVPPVPHLHGNYDERPVSYLIHDPKITCSNTVEVLHRGKLLHSCRPRVGAQTFDLREKQQLGLTFDFLELSIGMWSELDLIRHGIDL